MADLTEVVNYDAGVYQLETTDPVQGGASGVSNKPGKNLANRTAWLKQAVDALLASVVNATTSTRGIVKLASDADAIAGTDATEAVTPHALAATLASAQLLASSGYKKLPGGLILQWAEGVAATSEISQVITFPIAFPNACLRVFATEQIPSFVDEANSWFQVLSFTASNVTVQAQSTLTSWTGNVFPCILAMGY